MKFTPDSAIREFDGLNFFQKRKERIRLGMNDDLLKREQLKVGAFLGAWLGLSNFCIGMLCYSIFSLSAGFIITTLVFMVVNVYWATNGINSIHLNHQVKLAYERQSKSSV